jgi:hypothetical protein
MISLFLALALSILPQAASTAVSANDIKLAPKTIAELDMSKARTVIRRLAWNADNTQLYVQTAELKMDALVKTAYHYVIDASTGSVKTVDAEPAWAADYYTWKSWKSAPGDDAFLIELATEQRKASATGIPMGGDYARGGTTADVGGAGGGISMESAVAAAQQSQSGTANVMKLKGQVIGEWMNQPIVPGQSFGWGPQGSGLIAFAEPNNRQLIVMDKSGSKEKIGGTKGVYAPAFSNDGRKIAWLELHGKKAAVVVSDIAR